MATAVTSHTFRYQPIGTINGKGTISVSKDSYSIFCSITAEDTFGQILGIDIRYWKMTLQRLDDTKEVWNTVDTRTGYVTPDSPSHREFGNIGKPGSVMRIKVEFGGNSARTTYKQTETTNMFVR